MTGIRVTFRPGNRTVTVPPGTTILDAARRAGADLAAPCGGHGTCRRCRVLLPDRGSVLACQSTLDEETVVEIPATSRSGGRTVHLDTAASTDLTDMRPLDPLGPGPYGVAVDIGTSTIAAELIDLNAGRLLACAGVGNSQAVFGAEVTRRIEYAEDHGPEPLARAVEEDIRRLIDVVCREAGVQGAEIGTAVVAGNTTMIHLLFRLDPTPIRVTPHEPTVASPPATQAQRLNVGISPSGLVYALPWIGGWVGGDICGGILAAGLHREDRLSLLIDVGTNGEVVLGHRDWRLACAASAGPAFEGAGLRDGVTARPGAIHRVDIDEEDVIHVSTIGGAPAIGICGTGVVSGIAALFRRGWVDRAGQIVRERVENLDGEPGITWVSADRAGRGRPIGIVQRDIDSILRAKAALFAGARSLSAMTGVGLGEIERLVVCGGFGTAMDPDDAIALGMIPDIDRSRIESPGNTALRGARESLMHRSSWMEAITIAQTTVYVELIDHPTYFEEFTSAKFLPHTDASLFPRAATPRRVT